MVSQWLSVSYYFWPDRLSCFHSDAQWLHYRLAGLHYNHPPQAAQWWTFHPTAFYSSYCLGAVAQPPWKVRIICGVRYSEILAVLSTVKSYFVACDQAAWRVTWKHRWIAFQSFHQRWCRGFSWSCCTVASILDYWRPLPPASPYCLTDWPCLKLYT